MCVCVCVVCVRCVGAQMLEYPEHIAAVEHCYLPNGLVLLANSEVLADLSKDVDAYLANKSS